MQLNRNVTLTILRDAFAVDPDRVARVRGIGQVTLERMRPFVRVSN